jgi:hypothetical protein
MERLRSRLILIVRLSLFDVSKLKLVKALLYAVKSELLAIPGSLQSHVECEL